ncbi:saccharopine dehydrogenase [Natronolimnobius sp. AArcel1]|uniref:saccharopine dehydrogenase family protein n=1 Tax=Natronolimnobius sp. AArcel1 TaxID=1679093 RepID=UPI0013EA07B1|nr:saccharopine dehydrogenase NADP-binding domain-containing protein [Natronolimnobius sp. AArcel1]NGM69719.1 saccharopine dehydrogenase [Natronolimnobius sp. AArcel1]
MDSLLIYGSYGYTGHLVAREAVARGEDGPDCTPTLAGRDGRAVSRQAATLGVDSRQLALEDDLTAALEEFDAILNCAGPFTETVDPLLEACLETGTDYLDVTGEVAVFERLRQRDQEARAAGVTMVPGVGFEVVPSDCLAAMLAEHLPSADSLTLGVEARGPPSSGTAQTVLTLLADGGIVRHNGRLIKVPAGFRTRQIDFGDGPTDAVSVPWGDVVTAPYSAGVDSVEVYAGAPSWAGRALAVLESFSCLLKRKPVDRLLEYGIETVLDGPDDQTLATDRAVVWGELTDENGQRATARLETPNPYALTAQSAVSAAERALDLESGGSDERAVQPGFQTPATAFGSEFVLELADVDYEPLVVPTAAGDNHETAGTDEKGDEETVGNDNRRLLGTTD